MRQLLLISLILLSACKARQSELSTNDSLKNAGISDLLLEPDLPIPGTQSLFDTYFWTPEKGYVLPGSFRELVEQIARPSGAEPIGALIPIGRSLQKRAAHPNYFKMPRVLATFSEQEPDFNGLNSKLFLAYSAAAKQVEIISYNELMVRSEFQIIEQFGTPQARVLYASRAKCGVCHQGSIPILGVALWKDAADTSDMIADAVIQEIGADHYEGFCVKGGKQNHCMKSAIPEFDDMLRMTSFELPGAKQGFWSIGCPTSGSADAARCRTLSMVYAMDVAKNRGLQQKKGERGAISDLIDQDIKNENSQVVALKQYWDATAIGKVRLMNNSAIADRAPAFPFLEKKNNRINLDPIKIEKLFQLSTAPSKDLGIEDPAVLRTEFLNDPVTDEHFPWYIGDIVDALQISFDENLAQMSKVQTDAIIANVFAKNPNLTQMPDLNPEYFRYLISQETNPRQAKLRKFEVHPTFQPKLQEIPSKKNYQSSVLKSFAQHCAGCHSPEGQTEPIFMMNSDMETFEQIRQHSDRIAAVLTSDAAKPMPPANSPEKHYIDQHPEERNLLINNVKLINNGQ